MPHTLRVIEVLQRPGDVILRHDRVYASDDGQLEMDPELNALTTGQVVLHMIVFAGHPQYNTFCFRRITRIDREYVLFGTS